MEAAPPPQPATPAPADGDGAPAAAPVAWTEAHGHAWRQVFGDISGFVAHGVATGRPTASATNLTKSAEIVKARKNALSSSLLRSSCVASRSSPGSRN